MTIDKTALEILEDLPFRADDTWYTLLVYLGMKSGAWVDVHSSIWRQGEEAREVPVSTIRQIEGALKVLDLYYHIEDRITDAGLRQPDDHSRKRMHRIVDIYIACDQTTLDNIILARKSNDHKLLGHSLGYPSTAVEAFGTDKSILVSSLSPKVQLSETCQLTYFALSKDHWEEELAIVEQWIAAVKNSSTILWYELRSFADLVDDEFVQLVIESRSSPE